MYTIWLYIVCCKNRKIIGTWFTGSWLIELVLFSNLHMTFDALLLRIVLHFLGLAANAWLTVISSKYQVILTYITVKHGVARFSWTLDVRALVRRRGGSDWVQRSDLRNIGCDRCLLCCLEVILSDCNGAHTVNCGLADWAGLKC